MRFALLFLVSTAALAAGPMSECRDKDYFGAGRDLAVTLQDTGDGQIFTVETDSSQSGYVDRQLTVKLGLPADGEHYRITIALPAKDALEKRPICTFAAADRFFFNCPANVYRVPELAVSWQRVRDGKHGTIPLDSARLVSFQRTDKYIFMRDQLLVDPQSHVQLLLTSRGSRKAIAHDFSFPPARCSGK